ncbi:GDSL-type esterase/lipase family protein [Geminisphaera colitermitum]|uniref:GDSL-type esterase/lipase family protein n=1 Tax=Geminisphaera colitermitum TaxID=1148786 RepID=UPI0001965009|nr:GDSL-type esterase/lipase family protein [Geminisphaera colitermitum]
MVLAPRHDAATTSGAALIAIVGDSTVCNYAATSPRRGWGQVLPEYLTPGVRVQNEAKGGASTKTFPPERWQRALADKPGYVLIQFGHNDSHAKDKPESTDAATDFRDNLRRYIREARAANATPVLVTPPRRRMFRSGKLTEELTPWADAVRAVASETSTPLIDLHHDSGELFAQLGEDGSTAFTLNNIEHPGRTGRGDRTHFTETGARELARLVARRLAAIAPALIASSPPLLPAAAPRILHVSPQKTHAAIATGSSAAPFASIQTALDQAAPGDTVRVHTGVYHEYVSFRRSGSATLPITLEGESGAILDGSRPGPHHWQAAPDIAPGVYRLSLSQPVFTVTLDEKIIVMLRESMTRPGKAPMGETWEWPRLFANGVGDSGWQGGVGALALYLPEQKQLLLRVRGDTDPNTLKLTLSSLNKNDALIKIAATNHCVVRGLQLRNAAAGIRVTNADSTLIEQNTIGPADFGILLHEGATNAIVRHNRIFWNPYDGANPHNKPGATDHWRVHKRGGWLDRYGVEIRENTGGHDIHDNYIHDHWDGISARPFGDKDRAIRVHHNRIDTMCDDGLETAGAQIDTQWHDNIVSRCFVGVRIKGPTTGPLYIHRNIFFENREDVRNFGGNPEPRPAIVFVYHNTFASPSAAIVSNKVRGIGTPNYHFYNNLWHPTHWFLNAEQGGSVEPNWKADGNVYARQGTDARWTEGIEYAKRLGLDAHSLWTEEQPGFRDEKTKDFSLTEKSVARARGIDLSRHIGDPLPACAPGYFSGEAPDAGALSWGEVMPVLPRPHP